LDDQVYKIPAAGGPVIPISVGREPRQLTISHGTVYVTNYSSSDVYTIDEKRSRVVGKPYPLPANPYSLATDADGTTLWVGSQPDNKVSKLLTGRGG
jgi:DNA-binding beta-propeller fold protein YncE